MTRPAIGFIGLGMMGAGMAGCLLRAGHPLVIATHRSRAAVEKLTAEGATPVADLAALAAASDVIVTCVADSPALMEVADTIVPHLRPGMLWIDATTADPVTSRGLAQQVTDRGATFADAPVTGGPPQAEAGALASIVGCDENDWERVNAIVSHYSTVARRFGPPGAGHTAKLLNNLVTQGTMVLIAEAYGAAQRAGVDWQALFDVMSVGAARSGTLEKAVGPAIQGDFDGSRFSIRNATKDLTYAAAMLAAEGHPSALVETARDRMRRAVDGGHGARFVSRLLDSETAGGT